MIRLVALLALVWLSTSALRAGALENVVPQRGGLAASITWVDESGRVRKLSDLAGYPLVLLPIYTRCPSTCIRNVAQLKTALTDSKANPAEFRVLLFSFDTTDTPPVLAKYRERESVPLGWLIGTADQSNIEALLESLGFQYGKAGTEFMHPNLLVFLDSKLRVAKWLYGIDYSSRDVDAALQVAAGRSDWIGQHSDFFYAILLFAASLLCVALFQQVLRRSSMRARRAHLAIQKN